MKISVRVHEVYDNENSKVKGLASAHSAVSLQSTESKLLRAKRACLLQCRQN